MCGLLVYLSGEAEVIAAAYHHWGPAAVRRLRGMFAVVLWDRETGTLHAARDPFGVKPLYHLRTADGLFLASESKALLPFLTGTGTDQPVPAAPAAPLNPRAGTRPC